MAVIIAIETDREVCFRVSAHNLQVGDPSSSLAELGRSSNPQVSGPAASLFLPLGLLADFITSFLLIALGAVKVTEDTLRAVPAGGPTS